MRDMIPRGERSIRNIPVSPSHRRHPREQEPPEEIDIPETEESPRPPRRNSRRKFGRRFWLAAAVVTGVAVAAGLLMSTAFSGAVVEAHPLIKEVALPSSLEASAGATSEGLRYEIMTIRRSATTTVSASGTEEVSRQASGVITVYNAYSETAQLLIANTRFEAPDGKIYRIRESVTVPGRTGSTPGEISVTVYADSPGADYNRDGTTRFTIPGFRGDPRYDGFYAESQSGIVGGFVGTEPAVEPQELAQAEAELKSEVETAVRAAAIAELPEGYLPVPGTLDIVYSNIFKTLDGSSARLSQSAVATAVIIRTGDLASAIARVSLVEIYNGEAVTLIDPLSVSIALATSSPSEGPLQLQLSGRATLVWQFDANALKQELLGKKRSELENVRVMFAPAIERADASIRPFWQGSFPTDPDKIRVETVIEG